MVNSLTSAAKATQLYARLKSKQHNMSSNKELKADIILLKFKNILWLDFTCFLRMLIINSNSNLILKRCFRIKIMWRERH